MTDVINATTWDALNDRVTVYVEIERPGGVLRIPMRELTYHEWLQVEIDDPPPAPPVIAGKGGVKQYDKENPDYRRKAGIVYERWAYRRLLKALQVDVPGETEEEKLEALSEMSAPLLMALSRQVETMHLANKARVEDRAGSFQPGDDADIETDETDGLDA